MRRVNKRVRSSIRIFVFVAILLSTIYFPPSSHAQQVSLSLSPPLIEVLMKPGKSILIAYTLQNYGDPIIVSPHITSFEPSDRTGTIRIKDNPEGPIRFSLENADLSFNQASVLKSLETRQFLLRMRAPEGAPDGDYYYTFLAETEPPPVIGDASSSRARATIGANILITVSQSGRVDIQPKIALFDVLARFKIPFFGRNINVFDSSDPIPVVAVVENHGRNFFKPQGQIRLRGNFGESASFDITPQNVLAGSGRYLSASPSAELSCDESKPSPLCKRPTSLVLTGFFLGNYKLSTSVSFGEGTPNLEAATSFIALPLKFMLALIAVSGIAYVLIRKFKNW